MKAISTSGLRIDADLDTEPRGAAWGGGEVCGGSWRSPAKQSPNEDCALALPIGDDSLLLAVADGCGGMPAGHEAARAAIDALAGAIRDAPASGDLAGAVLGGFDAANAAVLNLRVGAGTTLAAALVDRGGIRAFHAGDSAVLVTGQRGRVRLNAIPHSPTGYGYEAGLLTESEALAHEDRTTILNVVGCDAMRVEVSPPISLSSRDTVLLATDGLTDNLYLDEIIARVRRGPLAAALVSLAEAASARMQQPEAIGHADDLTLLAYRPLIVRG